MTSAIINTQSSPDNFRNDLIEGCRKGDQKAQLQIYKLYYKSIYNICLKIANDPIAAEDIMHESFLAAFENISAYSGDTSFSVWLNSFIKYKI